MRQSESTKISLDIDDFCSHVFITGSTGSGKSNTIYQLIEKLNSRAKFLVIEPAKGEYKKVFGGICRVYSTNSKMSELLKINPFSFPEDIHVLVHIDRLIEIFNACWPMYAAMPAVLKDAIERSYENVGWNLEYSKCEPKCFPTFNDLMDVLPDVMAGSLYSSDTKSDYSGALITRVHSLTNGLNGQIFCSKGIKDRDLFDENVIVDLSRVGSSETKALIMGILIMKLQEYRMVSGKMNSRLQHVTILEEAHNLLRKTSMEQSQESSNLQGKSVEMLTNSIAEMRTYGEGFIIADQAPYLLDEAVIRNTNTKIALRLPDEIDRELVGKSMALNENQITELSKLPTGVAAVYQNNWVEAVLCKFDLFNNKQPLEYTYKEKENIYEHFFKIAFGISDNKELTKEDTDNLKNWINSLKEDDYEKKLMYNVIEGKPITEEYMKKIAYNLFNGFRIYKELESSEDEKAGINKASRIIRSKFGFFAESSDKLVIRIFELIVRQLRQLDKDSEQIRIYDDPEKIRRLL